jgi:hypothetical protein
MGNLDNIFVSLPASSLKELTASIRIGYQLLEITLVNGDILIGGLAKYWHWNDETIDIGYNAKAGKRFGASCVAPIPIAIIAGIQPIPLTDESIPRLENTDEQLEYLKRLGFNDEKYELLPVQDYPNPLATIIFENNQKVCKNFEIAVGGSVEMALSQDAIATEGIQLKNNFLLYADWDYFSRQKSGSLTVEGSIGFAGVSKELSPSLHDYVFSYLNSFVSKARQSVKVISPFGFEEFLARGCPLIPEPYIDTSIEGDECILVYCATSKGDVGAETYPVLVKKKCVKYPLEFLGKISSQLSFYGEMLPVPIEVYGKVYEQTILARAIGFLQ